MATFKTTSEALSFCEKFGLSLSSDNADAIEIAEALKRASNREPLFVEVDGVRSEIRVHEFSHLVINSEKTNISVVSIRQSPESGVTITFQDDQDYDFAEAVLGDVHLTSELLQKVVDEAISATKGISKAPTKYGEPPLKLEVTQ